MTSAAVASDPGARRRIRLVLVDDSATVRAVLRRALEGTGAVEVVGAAADGMEALALIRRLQPDVVTLDVEMPGMNGLRTLERLMVERPTPVVMVSGLTASGAEATLEALELGAVDFIEKPTLARLDEAATGLLVAKLQAATGARLARRAPRGAPGAAPPRPTAASTWDDRILAIGASTGGPQAVRDVLTALPADFGLPVVVVQHMPAGFTASLARRFDSLGPLPVAEAAPGMALRPGHVLLAPGGYHLVFDEDRRARLTEEPPEHGVRPAVDVTMASVAALPGARPIAVILTGMGRDGVRGCRAVARAGGEVIAEDESSCVVYGMPRAVVEAGLADAVVPLHEVAAAVVRRARAGRPAQAKAR